MSLKTLQIPNVTGGCTTDPYKGWIEIAHVHRSFLANSQNGNLGRASIQQFEIIARQDCASAAIHRALLAGTIFGGDVVIEYSVNTQDNKRLVLQRYTFQKMQIINVAEATLADGSDGESISIKFGSVSIESLHPDQTSAGKVTYNFESGVIK